MFTWLKNIHDPALEGYISKLKAVQTLILWIQQTPPLSCLVRLKTQSKLTGQEQKEHALKLVCANA